MSDWIDIYTNEQDIISKYNENRTSKIKQPPGFTPSTFSDLDKGLYNPVKQEDLKETNLKRKNKIMNHELKAFKKKKMWELAYSPAKSIFMNAVMSYMSPNDIQIIPIMMLFMLFINTFKEIFMVSPKFRQLDKSIDADIDNYDINIMKFVYILSCCGNLLVGLWKLNSMGLIPNKSSDWLGWEEALKSNETFI